MKKNSFNRFLTWFFRGLLFIAPIAFTVMVILMVLEWVDSLLPLDIPGLGIVIILVGVTSIGYMASTLLLRPIFDLMEEFLKKVPLVNIIYTSLKDLISAFVGDKRRFNKPVLVKMNDDSEIYKPGFITLEDAQFMEHLDLIAVYLPHSYAFSGNVYLMPPSNIKKWDVSSTDAMKFIVSGGVTGLRNPNSTLKN